MDFATLKAYMTNTSIKENVNSITVCAQRRLNVSKIERQSNRNLRLTQFRNIPENMSAYNTPQTTRIAVPLLAVPKPAANNASKLFQDKQNLRKQRLREYKEKKEKLKREEEAIKKPLFKVTHASLEKYNLENVYGDGNSGPYKFTAPTNIKGISLMVKTPLKAQDSPRKRVTRSNAKGNLEHATSTKKTENEPQKEQSKRPIRYKLRLQATKSEEMRDTNLFSNLPATSKTPVKSSTRIRNTEKVSSTSNVLKKSKNVDDTFFGASVTITNAERMLADSNSVSNLTQEQNKMVKGELNQLGKSKTTSKVKTKQKIDKTQSKTILVLPKTEEILSEVVKRLTKTGKTKSNASIPVKTLRSFKKPQAEKNAALNEGMTKSKLKEPKEQKCIVEKSSINDSPNKTEPKRPKTNLKLKQAEEDLVSSTKIKASIPETSSGKLKIQKATSKSSLKLKPSEISEDLLVACGEKKTPSKIDTEASSKTQKTSKTSLKSKTEHQVEENLQTEPQRRITRSNSQNTPSKFEPFQITTEIVSLEPIDVIVDIENNINEANIKLTSSLKTPENSGEDRNLAEKRSSLKTSNGNGDAGNYVYVSPFVTVSRGKDSARKEYAQRKSSGGTFNSPAFQQNTNVQTAAEYFTLLLDRETNKINNNCEYWNTFKSESNLPDEAVDMIDVAIGQGTLLRNKKMQSFRNLIQYSLEEQTDKPVTCMDLHGYWDVLNMQIDNVSSRYENLSKIRDNNWKEVFPEKPKRVVIKTAVSKKVITKPLVTTKRSNALLDAIKSRRLKAMSEDGLTKTPKADRNSVSSAKGTHKRVSSLGRTPKNSSIISPNSSSPHIMMQVSQVAKSVDRIGSEAVLSATKSILKKRQDFKINGRKPKVVLFDVSDDGFEDGPDVSNNNEKETHVLRRSTRLH